MEVLPYPVRLKTSFNRIRRVFGFEVGTFVFSIQHLYELVEKYPLCNGWYGINLTANRFNFNKIYLL